MRLQKDQDQSRNQKLNRVGPIVFVFKRVEAPSKPKELSPESAPKISAKRKQELEEVNKMMEDDEPKGHSPPTWN
jgi:hypothetical protein